MLPQEVLDSALQMPEVDQRLIKALEEVIESSAIGPWLTATNAAFDVIVYRVGASKGIG